MRYGGDGNGTYGGLSPYSSFTFSSPTFTGPITGAPTDLHKGGVPLIGLSSGSVAANGAISGITALPRVYPSAYCYFPANALATSIAAGWYYCTFSTTTAGVAYLNTYTSGEPSIPTSPTAVTDGKGAFTGDTSEEAAITVSVPALRTASAIHLKYTTEQTNNANAKTFNTRFSGAAGTIFLAQPMASNAVAGANGQIANTGATNRQISSVQGVSLVNLATPVALGTIDTSVATTLVFTMTRATATDNFVLLPPIVELHY